MRLLSLGVTLMFYTGLTTHVLAKPVTPHQNSQWVGTFIGTGGDGHFIKTQPGTAE